MMSMSKTVRSRCYRRVAGARAAVTQPVQRNKPKVSCSGHLVHRSDAACSDGGDYRHHGDFGVGFRRGSHPTGLGPDFQRPLHRQPCNCRIQVAILGTLQIIGGVIAIIVPLGTGAALYLEQFADKTKWWNRLIELNIQNLAGVPSIVFGILGLAFFCSGTF
jgi:hypothetical protein